MMASKIETLIADMGKMPGASEAALRELVERSWVTLPQEYLDLLRMTNGAEGPVGTSYLGLWPAERIISENKEYHASEFIPGLLMFGSSMGGVAYAFNGHGDRSTFVEVPFDSMDLESVIHRGDTLEEFLQFLASQWSEPR